MRVRGALSVPSAVLALVLALAATARAEQDPWARLPKVLSRIHAPSFPKRDFPITRYGAVPGGGTDATEAFRAAIAACAATGGGRVVVPAGEFLTGPIRLESRVNLHLEKGATVRFDPEPTRYLPPVLTRWEGVELMGYSPLVYALDATDVAVTGEGTLDGGASPERWWPWKGFSRDSPQKPDRDRLFRLAEEGIPVAERVFGEGSRLRPPFVQLYRCRNVLVEGVTLTSSPFWVIHPVLCRNVTVRDVKVVTSGPNNDGCNPESSSDVLIEDSLFDTGDDCIALKSGRNADGRRLATPVERVVVRRCRMRAGHGGVTIGSEISGGARDVFVEACEMSSPDLERGIRVKTNARRGGVIENLFVRDVTIGEVGNAVDVDMLYEEGANGTFPPTVRNLRIERLTVRKAVYALFLRALPGSPLRGFLVKDSAFSDVEKGSRIEGLVDLELRNVTLTPRPSSSR